MRSLIKLLSIILLFVLLSTVKNFSQLTFEGKVNVKLVYDDDVSFMDYLVKGNKLRMEIKDEEGENASYMITDMQEVKMFMLMPENKMYMEYPIEKTMEESKEEMEEAMEKVLLTNETKEINGFNCQKIIYNGEENIESRVTQDIGTFMLNENMMSGSERPEWYSEFAEAGFFPILVIDKDDSGEEESRWEIISVEQKSLSDDLFMPPSDYQKMEMPSFDFLK